MNLNKVLIISGSLLLFFSKLTAQIQNGQNDQFLFAIVELHQLENSKDYTVELKKAQVINSKLRIPTKSDKITSRSNDYVKFRITDDAQTVLDEVIIDDPFNVSYEYVDEDGNLKRALVPQKSRSILIRRPISDAATSLSVQPIGTKRSNQSLDYKFR